TEDNKLYLELFNMIDKDKYPNKESISETFHKKYPNSFLAAHVKYLFELILQVVVELNIKKNKEYELYNSYLKTKVLRERELYDDYLSLLRETKEKAKYTGDYNLLLTLQRDEIKIDSRNYFEQIREEDELIKKQHEINDNLKTIRQINEQSFLYETLRFKIEKNKSVQTGKPYLFNDLLISEMTLVSGMKKEIFEINRLHQLFQANYFISIGNYKSALNSFSELTKLYSENEQFWNNPPVYYVMVLEGVLESLKRTRIFEEMETYKDQLSTLTEKYPYAHFILEITAIEFIYSVAPYMYGKQYKECLEIINYYQESLIDKLLLLPPRLFLGVSICLSGIYLMNKDMVRARKQLAPIITNNTFDDLKIFRSVRLLNLIIYYELKETDYIESTIRSIKRKNKKTNKETQIEKLIFRYLGTEWLKYSMEKKNTLTKKFKDEIVNMKYSVDDLLLIKYFDFPEWILNKLE
ncbi:MAG: hypothetical protein LUF90_02420, partial [Rikenellaceae bacterium]|nr:hypothetical protein [Rikenellaceae bacterium]